MMIRESVEHALPEPDFEQRGGEFVATVWRDWLTEKVIAALGLNDRQRQVIRHVRVHGRISNLDHQNLFAVSKPTSTRDLEQLCGLGVLAKVGTTGRGTNYVLGDKGLIKGSKGSRGPRKPKSSQRAHAASADTPKPAKNPPNRPSTARVMGSGSPKTALLSQSGDKFRKPPNLARSREQTGAQEQAHEPMSSTEHRLLTACLNQPQTVQNLLRFLGYQTRTGNFKKALGRMVADGYLEMTIPDKPTSRLQQYRLTPKGRDCLAGVEP
jgi:DNA-binding MarR family transcriptional regulator